MNDTVTESVQLFGWVDPVDFNQYKGAILAKLYEQMLIRADGIVMHWRSDLFHDAIWLNEKIDGQGSFDWLVRTNGTQLGETAEIWWNMDKDCQSARMVWYKVALTCDDGMWHALFTTVNSVGV